MESPLLRAFNTRILLAILAALVTIGAVLVHQNKVSERNATATEKTAALLKQQNDQTDAVRAEDDRFRKAVEDARKNSHATLFAAPTKKP